jgi:hypothetical protein
MRSKNFRYPSFELLEDRRLLAGDIHATAPIADVHQLAAMFSLTSSKFLYQVL